MQYFTIQARNHVDAMDRMKHQYGSGARILTHRSVRMGGFLGILSREGIEITGYIPDRGRSGQARGQTRERQESGEYGSHAGQGGSRTAVAEAPVDQELEVQKRKILESVRHDPKRDESMREILDAVRSLKVDMVAMGRAEPVALHPNIAEIIKLLRANDFTETIISRIVGDLGRRFSLEELDDYGSLQHAVLEIIGDGLLMHRGPAKGNRPTVITVVGPTGVGKTTTIAKLAAVFSFAKNESKKRVKMVTIDNYKIAARKQIETYAEIMQIPAAFAESRAELERIISVSQDVDIILVDTIGKSPGDYRKLGEIKDILAACGSQNEVHLAISATTKTSDVVEILHQFEPFRYQAVILTKLDETTRVGNIVSVLIEHGKQVSYLTNGQMVPQDIEAATVTRFLMGLEGFHVDRERTAERYGENKENGAVWSS